MDKQFASNIIFELFYALGYVIFTKVVFHRALRLNVLTLRKN